MRRGKRPQGGGAMSPPSGQARPKGRRAMTRKYEIHSGRRTVSIQYSVSALQAVVDYVRSFGSRDDEIVRLGVDSVSWRGARFSAVLAPADCPAE